MPIIYTEEKTGRRSDFSKIIIDADGEETLVRKVTMPLYIREKDGFTWFLLYDDQMNLIRDFFEYLNFSMQASPLTTRRAAAFALRLLYCFLSLSGYKIRGLDKPKVDELVKFIQGLNSNPSEYASMTLRSANTVNGYLSTFRTYFADRHIPCDALFKSHAVTTNEMNADGFTSQVQRNRYESNVRNVSGDEQEVPAYISPEKFRELYALSVKNGDNVTTILQYLMYVYGLRPGEALGLTIDDIQEIEYEHGLVPVIILRNRMSDAPYQFAKCLPHVISESQYESKDYKKAKWVITISYDVYEMIMRYIEATHTKAIEEHPERYALGNADRVDNYDSEIEQNHYIFLNRYGKPLSLQTLNNHLKEYFRAADIPLDVDTRENNLAHRYRHGFAMWNARFRPNPVNALELQKMMRHKSIKSTMIYYNPTREDELETRTNAQAEFYKMFPEMKEGVTYID